MTRSKAVAARLQASKMPYDINEAGDTLFTCPMAWSVLEKVNELISALNVKPIMQATYLSLHPDCEADTFFEGRSLWDKILQAARTDVFIRLYMMLKHSNVYKHLWTHNEEWHCSNCANGLLHPCTLRGKEQLSKRQRVTSQTAASFILSVKQSQ
jgi:hypothetical protein